MDQVYPKRRARETALSQQFDDLCLAKSAGLWFVQDMFKRLVLFFVVAVALGSQWGRAEPSFAPRFESDWADGGNAQLRLVFGGWQADGTALVGVEMKLKPGWHTYWRTPGDAGLPPRFAWGGTEKAELRWPFPKPFTDNGYRSFGYDGTVIFPALVTAGERAMITLDLTYAVCAEICVLEEVSLALPIDHSLAQSPHRQAVRTALAESAAPVANGARLEHIAGDRALLVVVEQTEADTMLIETSKGRVLEPKRVSPGRFLYVFASLEAYAEEIEDAAAFTVTVRGADGIKQMSVQVGSH